MAARDRVADGADPEAAQARVAEGVRQRHADRPTRRARSGRPRWHRGRASALNDVRYAFRALRQEPGILADRDRRAHRSASASTPRSSPSSRASRSSRCAGVEDSSSLAVVLARTTRAARLQRCRIRTIEYVRDHTRAFAGLAGRRSRPSTWASATAASASGASSSPATTFSCSASRAQLGRTLLPSDEVAPGQHPVRRPQRRPVAPLLQRRSQHRRQDHPSQRVSPDRRRRRGSRRSTASVVSFDDRGRSSR